MSNSTTGRPVRLRFAPSPTGFMHIGNARTALFSWLYVRRHAGKFIIRLEDTDQKRSVEGASQAIYDGLRWLGLDWDEGPDVGGPFGPYVQSERLEHYQQWANWLVDNDFAYRCTCTPERLAAVREEQRKNKQSPGYDRHCRELNIGPDAEGAVVRFKMPVDGETVVEDGLRGDITVQNNTLQDLVLLKSDGFPTYHLAVVVDDHLMEISHVTRGDDWLPTFPVHWRLYDAFGWQRPLFIHTPMILNPNGKGKLSKREPVLDSKGNKVPVLVGDFEAEGFVPEAVTNFLTNIGWSFGDDQEFFTLEETIPRFTFERMNPGGGKYPVDKLVWLSGQWIQALDPDDLTNRLLPWLRDASLDVDHDVLRRIVPHIQERIKQMPEIVDMAGFFFRDDVRPASAEDLIGKKMDAAATLEAIRRSHAALEAIGGEAFAHDMLDQTLRALADELGLKAGQLFGVLRSAVTGQSVAPPLFETLEIVGREKTLARLKTAEEMLAAGA